MDSGIFKGCKWYQERKMKSLNFTLFQALCTLGVSRHAKIAHKVHATEALVLLQSHMACYRH